MPNDFQLNCNYRFCRRESATKPSDRFLCFYAPAVVAALSARVKMSVSKEQPEGVTCAWSAFVFGLRAPMDGLGITAYDAGGFCCGGGHGGEKLVSQQSLLNEVN